MRNMDVNFKIKLATSLIFMLAVLLYNDLQIANAETKEYTNMVKIVSPKNGDEVKSKVIIKGTSKIKDGSSVWVLVHLRLLTDQWWPQPKAVVQPNGDWEAIAFIGQPDDVGFDFEIAVATFDSEAEKTIVQYHEKGLQTQQWLPIKFPKTTSNIAHVTVKKIK
jgi:hypothetical protein